MKTEVLISERQEAMEALRESEQRYRHLLQATTDYIYTVKLENGGAAKTLYGPGCEAVTGYAPWEFEADEYLWYRIILEEDRPAVKEQISRIWSGEELPPLEHRIIHKDGRIRWISNTRIPHRDSQGRVVAYDGLISDITPRKHAEELLTTLYSVTCELAESSKLLEVMPGVLQTIGTILLWDYAAYWGVDAKAKVLHRQTAWFRDPPVSEHGVATPPGLILAPGAGLPGRVWLRGEPAWITDVTREDEALRVSVPDQQRLRCGIACPIRVRKEVVGVVELYSHEPWKPDRHMLEVLTGVGTLIGEFIERKRSEDALRESQERLALVIQGSNDGVWDWDMAANQVYFSPRWKGMLGYEDHEIENSFAAWAQLIHPEDRERAMAQLAAYFAGETPSYELEHRLRHKNGNYRWILTRGVALRDLSGRPIRMAGSHVDLTDLKLAAERLENANAALAKRGESLRKFVVELRSKHRELREAQSHLIQAARFESVGTLAAGVAHEVKNPLQTILMGLHYLAHKLPVADEGMTITLRDMHDAVNRANTIIGELLTMAAVREFAIADEDLNTVLQRALHLVQNQLDASLVTVVWALASDLPRVQIDRSKLQQVFINLFINAKQAMSHGGTLTVSTRAVMPGDSNGCEWPIFRRFHSSQPLVVAEIRDTGTGIKEANLPRIFDPFFTTKAAGEGTGLGLSVAKRIIEHHGGAIDVRNVSTGGVLVTVILKAT